MPSKILTQPKEEEDNKSNRQSNIVSLLVIDIYVFPFSYKNTNNGIRGRGGRRTISC